MNLKPNISFAEYEKASNALEVRMGIILAVVHINKKMLLLNVDFGEEETRPVVTNLGGVYGGNSEEILTGLQFPFITNLEPAIVSGKNSKAMIVLVKAADGTIQLPPRPSMAFYPAGATLTV